MARIVRSGSVDGSSGLRVGRGAEACAPSLVKFEYSVMTRRRVFRALRPTLAYMACSTGCQWPSSVIV